MPQHWCPPPWTLSPQITDTYDSEDTFPSSLSKSYTYYNLTMDRFDPSLGTLNSVDLSFQGELSFRLDATSKASGAPPFNLAASIQGDLMGSLDFTGGNNIDTASDTFSYSCVAPSGGNTCTIAKNGVDGFSHSVNTSFTSNADLNLFTGIGKVPLEYTLSFDDTSRDDIDTALARLGYISPGSRPTLTLTYNYTPSTPVPLPAAFWLMAAGLLGLHRLNRSSTRS